MCQLLNVSFNIGINTTQLNKQNLSLLQAPNQQNNPKQTASKTTF